ncbi:MAG: OB-fold nucleic acid binding domain-containing protein [Acidimicrobiales bacterium]
MSIRSALRGLGTSVGELDRRKLCDYCGSVEGTVPIAELQPRVEASVVGEITSLRIVPRPDCAGWLEATISDGTGSVVAMWTGRVAIAGVASGRRLVIYGRGAPKGRKGRLVILNPRYELLG